MNFDSLMVKFAWLNVEGGKAKAHFEGGVLNLEFDKLPDSKHAQQNIQIE